MRKKLTYILIFSYFFLIAPCESPVMYPMFIDSGFYAYTAQRIKEGKILYKEIWEAKFPAIYYIYTFLFTFFPESRWTLYFFDLFLTILILLILYFLLKNQNLKDFYILLAPFFLTIYRIYPSFSGGNLNEHYFIFFFLMTYYFLKKENLSKINSFFLGIVFIPCFLFKQNFVLFPLTLFILYREKFSKNFKYFISGFLIPFLFFVYIMLKGYPESIDCTILYPLYWSKREAKSFFDFIIGLKSYLRNGPLIQMLLLFLLSLFLKEMKDKREIIIFVFLSFFIIFKTPPSHPHYSLIFVIPATLSSIYIFKNFKNKKVVIYILIFLTLLPSRFIYLRVKHSIKALKIIFVEKDLRNVVNPVVFIIAKHLNEGETYIMNPPDPTIYFLTKTKSPLKFINFDYHISDYYREELKKEIREKPPDYIYWEKPISEFEKIFSLKKEEYKIEKIDTNFYKFKILK